MNIQTENDTLYTKFLDAGIDPQEAYDAAFNFHYDDLVELTAQLEITDEVLQAELVESGWEIPSL